MYTHLKVSFSGVIVQVPVRKGARVRVADGDVVVARCGNPHVTAVGVAVTTTDQRIAPSESSMVAGFC